MFAMSPMDTLMVAPITAPAAIPTSGKIAVPIAAPTAVIAAPDTPSTAISTETPKKACSFLQQGTRLHQASRFNTLVTINLLRSNNDSTIAYSSGV